MTKYSKNFLDDLNEEKDKSVLLSKLSGHTLEGKDGIFLPHVANI